PPAWEGKVGSGEGGGHFSFSENKTSFTSQTVFSSSLSSQKGGGETAPQTSGGEMHKYVEKQRQTCSSAADKL
ncbi:hypothetical protein N339_12985, partial [Pterocles gutturalis]